MTTPQPLRIVRHAQEPAAEAAEGVSSGRAQHVTVITPPAAWPLPDLREVWRYRDMLVMLATRDIAVRYRQSVLGVAWAVIRPLISMAIFTIIFGRVAGLDDTTGGVPYPLFAFAALLPWMFFSTCLTETTNSVVAGGDMLTKIYFPRLVLPLSKVAAASVDFSIQFVVLLGLMAIYRIAPTTAVVALPAFILLATAAALAGGLWMTALNVRYRDVTHALPFFVQAFMYLCPVIYPATLIPERWRPLYYLNPMAGVIEGFRWALLDAPAPNAFLLAVSALATTGFLIAGMFYFAKTEQSFADVI